MGALTEIEIFAQLAQSFRLAAELSIKLAIEPRKGPNYVAFRTELKLIGGCCRQAAAWREDTRWLEIDTHMAKAHRLAGGWLRGIRLRAGQPRVKIAASQMHPMFLNLAAFLEHCAGWTEDMKTKATGRVGMILPKPQRAPTRTQGRPIQVLLPPNFNRTPGGLIVPAGMGVQ